MSIKTMPKSCDKLQRRKRVPSMAAEPREKRGKPSLNWPTATRAVWGGRVRWRWPRLASAT